MTFAEIMSNYAFPIVAMSAIVLILTGIVKIFTKMIPADNSKLSEVMSKLYVIIAAVFSFGVCVAYFALFSEGAIDWFSLFKHTCATFTCSQAMYPIYRDYGGRYILLAIVKHFKSNAKTDDAKHIMEVVEKFILLTESQKQRIEAALQEEIKK